MTRREYDDTREVLLAAERAHDGEDGVLERLLPTASQILAHCELRWEKHWRSPVLRARDDRRVAAIPRHPSRRACRLPRSSPSTRR